MKVSIQKELLNKYPNVKEHIVVAKDVNVMTSRSREIIEFLKKQQEALRDKYDLVGLFQEDLVRIPVDTYQDVLAQSGISTKKAKRINPSHVALAKRVVEGGKIPNINPLVNMYNAVSIKHLVSIGAEDLDKYYGDVELKFMNGTETFQAIGDDETELVNEGEVCWIDDKSVTCRMWGWRQNDRTKVDKHTRNIIFYIDQFIAYPDGIENPEWQTTLEIAKQLKESFGVETSIYTLDSDNPVVEVDFKSKEYVEEEHLSQDDPAIEQKKLIGNKGIRKRKAESLGLTSEETLLATVEKELSEIVRDVDDLGLDYSPNGQFGEISSNAPFRLAAKLKISPKEAGLRMAEQINGVSANTAQKSLEIVEKAEVAENGFVNMKLTDEGLLKLLEEALNHEEFGSLEAGQGKRMLVESPGWNPNKTPHVGHLLNLLLGKSLIRVFNKAGLEAVNDDIDNDKGLPVMQTVWSYMKYGDDATPDSTGDKADHFVHRYYTLGKKKYDESDEVKEEVKKVLRKWEGEDPQIRSVWRKLVGWAYQGQKETMARIWEEPGHVWHESDVYQGGKDIVLSHLGKGVVERLDDGAVIARIEQEYGLPDTILVKSDGSGLYHTQDVNLTMKKKEKFEPWKIIWVVGEEQIAHFQRLFAVLDALGIMPIDDLYHYPYAHVVSKDGKKIASRDGSDMSADEMLDVMHNAGLEVLKDRGVGSKDNDIEEIEGDMDPIMENIAEVVGIGAIKYALLSRDPFKKIKFDIDKAISFTGKSGPYIMYTYTRAVSILKKLGIEVGLDEQEDVNVIRIDDEASTDDTEEVVEVVVEVEVEEKNAKVEIESVDISALGIALKGEYRKLLLQLLKYPEVVLSAANNYSPGILAEYLYDLAKDFNNYYENVKIIGSQGDELSAHTALLKLHVHVVKDGLEILGIKVLDRM